MTTNQSAITIEHLITGYHNKHGKKVIARDINARLEQGQLTCLLGPNGAGKSTLLKTLTGMIPPLGGKIMIGTDDIANMSAHQMAMQIGVVLTERLMVSNMTVEELVSLGRSPYTGFWGKLSENDIKIVDDAISLVHIRDLRTRMIDTLSDGERQKVMIAKALAQSTPIIFLDEPTAFLDYPSKVEILQLLLLLTRERGITVFLSTHDLELALQIADELWLIDKMRGVTIGTPEDLALDGSLSKYFDRKGVEFDLSSGLFKISSCMTSLPVVVKGDGPAYAMACKALRRIGLRPVDSGFGTVINAGSDGFEVDGISYRTVKSLIDAVRNLPAISDKHGGDIS